MNGSSPRFWYLGLSSCGCRTGESSGFCEVEKHTESEHQLKNPGDKIGARGTSHGPRPDWRTKAACREFVTTHYDPWEANPTERKPSHTAEVVCGTCPVKRECLLAGIASDAMNHHGVAYHVFGGLAPAQRRAITRARHRLGCPVCKGDLLISPTGENWQVCASCGVTWKTRNRKPLNEDVDQDDTVRASGTGLSCL
jgi:hypothetical protein